MICIGHVRELAMNSTVDEGKRLQDGVGYVLQRKQQNVALLQGGQLGALLTELQFAAARQSTEGRE